LPLIRSEPNLNLLNHEDSSSLELTSRHHGSQLESRSSSLNAYENQTFKNV